MTDCPSCGRYVGPYDRCPYCSARLEGRLRIRTIKVAAVACSIVGLAVLLVMAATSEVPHVFIGQIDGSMDRAYVRVSGTCIDASHPDEDGGYLGFWIDDGTGRMYVSSYEEETRAIVAGGQVPVYGDRLQVAGSVRVRDGVPSLVVVDPESLETRRPDPAPRSISDLTADDELEWVAVRGQVRAVREPYPGLTLITVHDGSGSIPVAVGQDGRRSTADGAVPDVGQSVEVVGAVSDYRGSPQIVPASSDAIVRLGTPIDVGEVVTVGAISANDLGHLVKVRGTVTDRDEFSAGVKLTLEDGSGRIALLLWRSLFEGLVDGGALQPGAAIEAVGEVVAYRGDLEVVPEIPSDVAILQPAVSATAQPVTPTAADAALDVPTKTALPMAASDPTMSPTPPPTSAPGSGPSAAVPSQRTPTVEHVPIAGVGSDRAGEWAVVEGDVVQTSSFSAGFKFVLDDGTGQIVLVMWHDVYDSCRDYPAINVGARVRARGEVAVYEGELQLQPRYGADVTAIKGAPPWAALRQIGTLTGDDAGGRVMIEGRVIRVESVSSAAKVFVGDDSGEVLVLVWHNILDRVESNTGLGTPGTKVRVVGDVDLYRSNLEVIPALPVDVVVLSGP